MRVRAAFLLVLAIAIGYVAGRRLSPPAPAGSESSSGARVPGPPHSGVLPTAFRPSPESAPIPEDLSPDERRNIEVFRRASASVVHIASIALERDSFSFDILQVPQGTGSGFVWDKDGHIVTNYHVIADGDAFRVRLDDQSEYDARVVGRAPDKDIAVLRIKAGPSKLVPIPRGTSQDLLVGQRVLAVGNPFGLDHTLTIGIVSALGRELSSPNGRTIHDVIQTDAAINPGNSGGPLLDSRGRLIGVNSAIFSPSGASAGIGFAIPVDTVANLVPQLIAHGKIVRPGIGVVLLPDAYAERKNIAGVIIQEVQRGSPAARAGLVGLRSDRFGDMYLGDVIVAADGRKVETRDDLLTAFESAGSGASVTLTVVRDDRRRQVKVTLEPVE